MAKYIINHNSKEIHRSAHVKDACKIRQMHPSHREDTNHDTKIARLIQSGYNGCFYCYRSQDTG